MIHWPKDEFCTRHWALIERAACPAAVTQQSEDKDVMLEWSRKCQAHAPDSEGTTGKEAATGASWPKLSDERRSL
jgi:hypothetical protein